MPFGPAIKTMQEAGQGFFGPCSFQDYLTANQIPGKHPTAERISVQQFSQLRPELREQGLMVFRLGSGHPGTGTSFGLVRASSHVHSFFLFDEELFPREALTFEPQAQPEELFPFQITGDLVEVNAVNLAIASGLLGHALRLDEPVPRVAPATTSSTFSFDVLPEAAQPLRWQHLAGQVEIDTLVMGRRAGRRILFIIEAKHSKRGRASDSLAKTKLVYACKAIQSRKPPLDLAIVPVYMRSWVTGGIVHYGIAECGWEERHQVDMPVADLQPRNSATSTWRLPMDRSFGRDAKDDPPGLCRR